MVAQTARAHKIVKRQDVSKPWQMQYEIHYRTQDGQDGCLIVDMADDVMIQATLVPVLSLPAHPHALIVE